MPGQFALPGLEEPPRRPQETKPARREPPPHSLFFAVMPAPADLTHIGPAAAALRRQHGMTRGLVKDERLHVTCCDLGGLDEEPSQERIDEASAVAAGLVLAPFEVIFSRVMRFKGNGALVLLEDDGATALRAFRQALAQALTEAGVWHDSKGTLHMTLGYGGNDVSERLTEPVRWVAQGFVLIHSVRGKTEHRRLGRWPLAQPG